MLYEDFRFLRGSERKELVDLVNDCMSMVEIQDHQINNYLTILEDLVNSVESKVEEDNNPTTTYYNPEADVFRL